MYHLRSSQCVCEGPLLHALRLSSRREGYSWPVHMVRRRRDAAGRLCSVDPDGERPPAQPFMEAARECPRQQAPRWLDTDSTRDRVRRTLPDEATGTTDTHGAPTEAPTGHLRSAHGDTHGTPTGHPWGHPRRHSRGRPSEHSWTPNGH